MLDKSTWIGVQNALDRFSVEYNLLTKLLSFGQADKLRMKIAEMIKENDRVLELGCGPGILAKIINAKEYVGVDPLDSMIRIARLSVRKPNVKFLKGFAEKIPLESSQFDVVVCSFSFRDFLDKERALEEILRVLKKDGRLIILDIPGVDTAHKVSVSFFYLVTSVLLTLSLFDKRFLTLKDFVKSIWAMPTLKNLVKLLVRKGFKEIKIKLYLLGLVFILEAKKK